MKSALRSSLAVALVFFLHAFAHGGEAREWTDRLGRKFEAEIIANDSLRATFALPGKGKAVLPLAQLSAKRKKKSGRA